MNHIKIRTDVAEIAKEVRAKAKELGSVLSVRTRRDFTEECEGLWIEGSHHRTGEYFAKSIERRFIFIGWLVELCNEHGLEWINMEDAHSPLDRYIVKRKKCKACNGTRRAADLSRCKLCVDVPLDEIHF